MHHVRVAVRGDCFFGRLRLAARVDDGARLSLWLRLEHGVLDAVILPLETEVVFLPHTVNHFEPLCRARVSVVVLLEPDAVLARLVRPPGGDDVERQTTAAADVVDVGRLLRQKRGVVEGRTHGDHQLKPLRDGGERGGC